MALAGAIVTRVLFAFGVLCLLVGKVDSVNGTTSTQAPASDGTSEDSSITALDSSLETFYSIVTGFLDSFKTPPLTDPDAVISVNSVFGSNSSSVFTLLNEKWQDFLKAYHGLAACIVVGVIFIIFMPIIGLILCCCRTCCKNCRCKRNTRTDKSRCCKFSLSLVLFLVNSLILCACVFTFISAYLIREDFNPESSRNILSKTAASVGTLNTFINKTMDDLITGVVDTFEQTSDDVLTSISNTANDAVDDVMKTLNISSFISQAKDLGKDVSDSLVKLKDVKSSLTDMKNLQQNLSSELDDLKTDTNALNCSTLTGSSKTSCDSLKTSVTGSNVAVNYTGLDTLQNEIDEVEKTTNISSLVTDAEKEVTDVETQVRDEIDTNINESKTEVDSLKTKVKDEIKKAENDIRDQLQTSLEKFKGYLTDAREDVKSYNIADYLYAFYSVPGVIGVICLLYFIALLYSLFGTQNDEAENCCTFERGAAFLVAGVVLTFIFAWLLMIICLLMFAVGGSIYTLVCNDFVTHNPADLKGLEDFINDYMDFGDKLNNVSVSSMLTSCQDDEALYKALQLENLFDPDKQIDIAQLVDEVDKIANTSLSFNNITILSNTLEDDIKAFNRSGIGSINFTNYETELGKQVVTGGNFATLSKQASDLASSLPASQQKNDLNAIATKLSTLQTSNIASIESKANDLRNAINYLKNFTNINTKTNALIKGLQDGQDTFNNEGITSVTAKMSELAKSIVEDVKYMKDKIIKLVKEDLAHCKPVYDTFYQLTDIACVSFLNHWNGYWFGLGWALAFFVPAIIFALILAGLFRSDEVIKAHFDDPDVSGYESHGQDRIPLTSTQPSYNNDAQPYRVAEYGRGERSQNYDNRAYRDDRGGYKDNTPYREAPPAYNGGGYDDRRRYDEGPYRGGQNKY